MPIIVYKDCADVQIPPHICDDCEDKEKGGIRSISLIKNGKEPLDPTDSAEWIDGIESGDIIVVPATRGNYDGGSPVTGPGYGDALETIIGYTHTLLAHDPAYAQNGEFWKTIRKARNFKVAWRTQTQVHISEAVVSIAPINAVEEDLTSVVDWQVTFTWQGDLSIPYDATALKDDVFRCFKIEP